MPEFDTLTVISQSPWLGSAVLGLISYNQIRGKKLFANQSTNLDFFFFNSNVPLCEGSHLSAVYAATSQ